MATTTTATATATTTATTARPLRHHNWIIKSPEINRLRTGSQKEGRTTGSGRPEVNSEFNLSSVWQWHSSQESPENPSGRFKFRIYRTSCENPSRIPQESLKNPSKMMKFLIYRQSCANLSRILQESFKNPLKSLKISQESLENVEIPHLQRIPRESFKNSSRIL